MSRSVMMAELSWVEYERRLVDEDAIVFLPVGSVEQHGFGLPLSTDTLLATYMAQRAAEAVGGVVAAPITYGYRSQVRSGGGPHRQGTVNLGAATLVNLARDILIEFIRHGARKIAVIDGHLENRSLLDEACHLAIEHAAYLGRSDVRVFKMLYAERISPHLMEAVYRGRDYPGLELEHAGLLETAMMLACHPELVDMSKLPQEAPAAFPPYDMFPPNPGWVPPSGSLSPGTRATAEMGRMLLDEFAGQLISSLRAEFRSEAVR